MKPIPFLVAALACATCGGGQDRPPPDQTTATPEPGCLAAGDGSFVAQLRGAMVADLAWGNADMQCEGGQRPDGQGLRLTFAGPLPQSHPTAVGAARHVRFIFGIDPTDTASGSVQALPTNMTVILEGEEQMFATRGDGRCAVETLERTPLDGKRERVHARGYCLSPAVDLRGEASLLVPTFEFTGVVAIESTEAAKGTA